MRLAAGWNATRWLRLGLGAHAITGHNLVEIGQTFDDTSQFADFSQSIVLSFSGYAASAGLQAASKNWTLALSIYEFPNMQPGGWGNQLIMCIALIVMLPVVVGFFFLQRWLIEGVNLTGVSR